MNKYDDFFSKLTLVTFGGGRMGSFLINFLTAENEIIYNRFVKQGNFGLRSNHEWHLAHYFENAHNIKKETIEYTKNFYGANTYLKQTLFSYAKLIDKNFINKTVQDIDLINTFTGEKALELVNEEFTSIKFPYVKDHPAPPTLHGNIILPYKNRIFCYFPPGKQWIANFFVLYKHHLYKIFHNNNNYDYGLENIPLLALIGDKRRQEPEAITLENHTSVNMYELVFNKNLEDIYKIYPGYKPNQTQLKLLDMAHDTSMLVLKDLGLSHEMVVEDNYLVRKFLNDTGIIKTIHEYLKYSRTLKNEQ